MDEFNEVRRQIESNDPDLVELDIEPGDYVPHDGDWGRLGIYIGRNTRLKKITFGDNNEGGRDIEFDVAKEDFEKFFHGVACSRSIKGLCFRGCDLFGGDIFRILLPLFKRNQVECLGLISCGKVNDAGNHGIPPACSRSLAAALGEFDSLKEFELFGCRGDDNEMEEVIRALAGHSGLRKLDLRYTPIGRNVCAAFSALLHNPNSELSMLNRLGRNACVALAAWLQNPNSELSVLNLCDSGIGNKGADALAPGLAVNSSLKDLNLGYNWMITEMERRAIFTALQSPSCRLEKLSLECNGGINDAAFVLLSSALRNNTTLKSLNLSFCLSITIAGWRALFGFLQDPSCTLKELDLCYNNRFNNNVTISLSNALTNNKSLGSLKLSGNREIATAGWQAFSAVLESTNSGLEKLDLSYNMINDEAVNSIANALINNSRLRELDLRRNEQVTVTGWGSFSAVLESPLSALEKLDLRRNEISNATLSSFANSVANNSKLKELLLDLVDENGIAFNWRDEFSRVLCNTSSITDTYQSNHTLQKVSNDEDDDEDVLPQEIRSLLELNRDNSKAQAARLKIIKTHFSGGFTVHPFVDMERNVLPHAIAWIGRDGRSNALNGLYGFLKRAPQLFDAAGHDMNQMEE